MSSSKTRQFPVSVISILLLSGLLIASLLIVLAARGDLWLDEIWSLWFAENAVSPLDLLTRFQHDNNHLLNTLYLYLLGQQSNLYLYRLLAVTSGLGSLILLTFLARQKGAFESLCVLFMAGTSYPLILYFSEARGYAPAIFFALLAYLLLQRCLKNSSLLNLALFWTAVVLGILAHLTFVNILLALFCLTLGHEYYSHSPPGMSIKRIASLYVVPFVFFGIFYFTFVTPMIIGGGDSFNYWDVVSYATVLISGFPEGQFARFVAFAFYAGSVGVGVYILFRNRNEQWLFYLVALVAGPTLMLFVARPQVLYFRYFVVCFPFYYLLMGSVLGGYCRGTSVKYMWAGIAIVCLMAVGHASRVIPLLKLGRGGYMTALSYISTHTPGQTLRIGSDHDFRNGMVLSFYSRFLPGQKRVDFINQGRIAEERPDWILTHSQDLSYQPPTVLRSDNSVNYRLVEQYRFAGDSGWNWFLYHIEYAG
jgi:hypothetical protein